MRSSGENFSVVYNTPYPPALVVPQKSCRGGSIPRPWAPTITIDITAVQLTANLPPYHIRYDLKSEASNPSQQFSPQSDINGVWGLPYEGIDITIERFIVQTYSKLWNQINTGASKSEELQTYQKLWNRMMTEAYKSHGSLDIQEVTCRLPKRWNREEEKSLERFDIIMTRPEQKLQRRVTKRYANNHVGKGGDTIRVSNPSEYVEDGRSLTDDTYSAATLHQFHEYLAVDMQGRKILQIWKHSAGRHKSWRRYPRPTTQMCARQSWNEQKRQRVNHMLSISLLWLPSAMLRSRQREPCSRIKRLEHRQAPGRSAIQIKFLRIDDVCEANEEVVWNDSSGTTHLLQSETRDLNYELDEECGIIPGKPFVRFTWKERTLVDGVGQLDRFLPSDLLFCSGWRIAEFIRNDDHADVYSLSKLNIRDSKPETECLEAHVFLDEYHGNSQVFANRQKARMRRSGHCFDSFWYRGRHVLVVKTQKRIDMFELRNNEKEFPSLVSQKKCMKHVALQRRFFRGRLSFADVAKRSQFGIEISMSSTTIKDVKLVEKTRREEEVLQRDRGFFQAWKEHCQEDLESFRKERRMAEAELSQTWSEHCQLEWGSHQRESEMSETQLAQTLKYVFEVNGRLVLIERILAEKRKSRSTGRKWVGRGRGCCWLELRKSWSRYGDYSSKREPHRITYAGRRSAGGHWVIEYALLRYRDM